MDDVASMDDVVRVGDRVLMDGEVWYDRIRGVKVTLFCIGAKALTHRLDPYTINAIDDPH